MVVAALGGLLVALVGLLVLFAFTPLLRAVGQSLGASLPGALGWLADAFSNLEVRVSFGAYQWALGATAPLRDAFLKFSNEARGLGNAVYNLAGTITHLLNRILTQDLPAAQAASRAYSDQVALQAAAGAEAGRIRAQAYADQLGAQAAQTAAQDLVLARDYASGLGVDLQAQISQSLSAAETYADQNLGRALDTARGVELEALRGIEAGIRTAEAYADQVGSADRAYAEQVGQAARDFAGRLGLQEQQYTDLRTGALGVALASGLAASALAVKALEDSACMQRCNTLGDLGAAIEAIDLGAILGLLALALADPPAATAALRETMVPIVEAAEQGAQELIQVAS